MVSMIYTWEIISFCIYCQWLFYWNEIMPQCNFLIFGKYLLWIIIARIQIIIIYSNRINYYNIKKIHNKTIYYLKYKKDNFSNIQMVMILTIQPYEYKLLFSIQIIDTASI